MKKLFQPIFSFIRLLFGFNQTMSKSTYRMLCGSYLLIFVLLWQYTFPPIIPKFDKMWEEFQYMLLNDGLVVELGSSLKLVLKAMFWSVLVSFTISYLGKTMNAMRPFADLFEYFRFWSLLGFTPIVRVLTADGDALRLTLVMFAIVPFMVSSFNKVLLDVEKDPLYDYAYTLGFSELRATFFVVFRSRLKLAILAIAANFAIAWIMMPTAEVASRDAGGIGALLFDKTRFVQGQNLYAAAFTLQLIILTCGIFFDFLFNQMHKALPEERAKLKTV